jgi:hypothetical protein
VNLDLAKRALEKGQEMREKQSQFFRTRDRSLINPCRRLEREFDELTAQALASKDDLFSTTSKEHES